MDDRLNSPDTTAIIFKVMDYQLHFSQDPNSKHLGTTVWDASMVFVKFLEKNCRKGKFSPAKLQGKRVIELGAGCGLAGFGMALLGCDVISTDQVEVLPLLIRNVERNTSRIMQEKTDSAVFGSIQVAELDWGNLDHIKAVEPPFDYIIGTDVVYAEHLLEPLLQTILALSGPRTTVLLGYEIRSTSVHDQMMDMWKSNFEVKTIPKAKMDGKYQHESIQLFALEPKLITQSAGSLNHKPCSQDNERDSEGPQHESAKEIKGSVCKELIDCPDNFPDSDPTPNLEKRSLDEWEARRYGSKAARLLRDIKTS